MQKKKLHPLAIIFIVAVMLVTVTFVVLYTVFGLRYINDKIHELKFVGEYESGVAVSGKIYYYDGRVATLDAMNKTILFEDGSKYTGALSGYLPHGTGTLVTADGTIFEGDFYEGYPTGKVTVTYVNGDIYKGDVDHGTREGVGVYTKNDGTVYQGSFKDGEKNGFGITHFPDSSVYIGEYKDSIKNGVGAYLFEEGDIFVGDFVKDKRTGRGIYLWAKSEEYSNEFESLFDVTLTDDFKSTFLQYFEGDFERHFTETANEPLTTNPFFQAFEKILSRNQLELYVGGFNEGVLEGEGKYRWLSGRVYEGTFKDGVVFEEVEN